MQAYALQTVLERMGHEAVVLDSIHKHPLPAAWRLPLCFAMRVARKCMGSSENIFIERSQAKRFAVIGQNIRPFVEKRIHRKRICRFGQLKAADYDAIVVGSDQVWRPVYFRGWGARDGRVENAYLAFARRWRIKRIAYAASFGTSEWEYDDSQTRRCRALAQRFDAVSVREQSGTNLCRDKFGVEAVHVLDPTMLLSSADYAQLFRDANVPKSKGNLLSYVLDANEEIKTLIEKVAVAKGLTPFEVNNPVVPDGNTPMDKCVKISVEEWLRGFHDAEFVITDSFHACVFSIIFRKQFLVTGNKARGMSRFHSLLSLFGLESRLVDSRVDLSKLQPIDYDRVYERYDELKRTSTAFLQASLKSDAQSDI